MLGWLLLDRGLWISCLIELKVDLFSESLITRICDWNIIINRSRHGELVSSLYDKEFTSKPRTRGPRQTLDISISI